MSVCLFAEPAFRDDMIRINETQIVLWFRMSIIVYSKALVTRSVVIGRDLTHTMIEPFDVCL